MGEILGVLPPGDGMGGMSQSSDRDQLFLLCPLTLVTSFNEDGGRRLEPAVEVGEIVYGCAPRPASKKGTSKSDGKENDTP